MMFSYLTPKLQRLGDSALGLKDLQLKFGIFSWEYKNWF